MMASKTCTDDQQLSNLADAITATTTTSSSSSATTTTTSHSNTNNNTTAPFDSAADDNNTDNINITTSAPTQTKTTNTTNTNSSSLSREELEKLLEIKEREISLLKFELEKYKLALRQLQTDHNKAQQQYQKSLISANAQAKSARGLVKCDHNHDGNDAHGDIDDQDGDDEADNDSPDDSTTVTSLLGFAAAQDEQCLVESIVGSSANASANSLITTANMAGQNRAESADSGFNRNDPFSPSNLANQAALAISAAAAAVAMQESPHSSSDDSLSPNSTIQADLSSGQSLANVVAAAAAVAAAAVANDQHHHHQQQLRPHHHHQQQLHHHHHHHQQHHHQQAHNQQTTAHQQHQLESAQSRLISSALSTPEFYHNLHQHQQRVAAAAAVAAAAHQQHQHPMSPMSPLNYSPSTSITPSPSPLMGLGSSQSRRSATGSNASSSFMSPISSPNYLRRQFMPDRLPLLSPSPTLATATGSSSAIGSNSLANILQQHHQSQQQQQRSASALAGPIAASQSSQSSMSGAGSNNAVSSIISSKNSSQARLNNMQIRHKFGYLGSGRGQFNSPHGFCLGLNQEIVVADTNNHRICIFDKSGSYITQFGSPGKDEGQLWNPRKVAILHRPVQGSSGTGGGSTSNITSQIQKPPHHHHQHGHEVSTYSSHFTSAGGIQSSTSSGAASGGGRFASDPLYVVCDRGAERSRMQLFTKDGVFIKKIGIHYIDIVAGLAITQNGLIIVVDSVSPTVYIINAETGTLNGWFDCSGHMKEPSDIAVKSDIPGNEYFICDFKGHCVVVFSEQGEYLRKIGHDGLTSYPNGIDISDDGDILVGDSHGNRFHVVVFDRNGNFVSQFECPHVKVSRCCGLKITREGYIVTLAKNNHHVLVLDTIHI